jgi:hypothetical protein
MDSEKYLEILKKFVWPIVSEWKNAGELLFMQSGVPPSFALTVRVWLDNQISSWFIGCQEPMEWPTHRSDITPCDFFLCSWVKDKVYK